MTAMPFKDKNNIFAHLETLSDYYAMDPEDRKLYDSALRRSRDYYATIESAKVEGRDEGRVEGRAEGRIEGRAEGRVEGRAEGRVETNVANAREMKKLGVDYLIISKVTGLSNDEIEKL
ncbi:MAG: hypothetical protein MJZ28_03885 [Paludibacteraceae bacterium]|nr:hypothetical protein [Paludibacteraceae bacterium]